MSSITLLNKVTPSNPQLTLALWMIDRCVAPCRISLTLNSILVRIFGFSVSSFVVQNDLSIVKCLGQSLFDAAMYGSCSRCIWESLSLSHHYVILCTSAIDINPKVIHV